MFCSSCGKPVSDGSVFCANCGNRVGVEMPKQPLNNSSVVYAVPATGITPKKQDFTAHFRTSWRVFASSALILVFAIFFSAGMIFNILEVENVFSEADDVMRFFSVWSGEHSVATELRSLKLTVIKLLVLVPGVLIAIGIWMTYGDAADKSDRFINASGIKLVLGVVRTLFVLFCIGAAIVLIAEITGLEYYNSTSAAGIIAEQVLTPILQSTIVVVPVIGVLFWLVIRAIAAFRNSATSYMPDTGFVIAGAVVVFIVAVLNVLMLWMTEVTLGGLINCVSCFLLGAVFVRFHSVMTALKNEKFMFERLNASLAMNTMPVYVMQQNAQIHNNGTWTCRCGRINPKYVSSCSCGVNKSTIQHEQQHADDQEID